METSSKRAGAAHSQRWRRDDRRCARLLLALIPMLLSCHHDTAFLDRIIDVSAVSVGSTTTCALAHGGRAYCWGSDGFTMLLGRAQSSPDECPGGTIGPPTHRAIHPASVDGLDHATRLAVGANHACGVGVDGVLSCWGSGLSGALGLGTFPLGGHGAVMGDGIAVRGLGAAEEHTCGLDASSSVWCWGTNRCGQVGYVAGPNLRCDGSTTSSLCATPSPTHVDLQGSGVSRIAVGGYSSCAVLEGSGELRCWGLNAWGQLGTDQHLGTCTMPSSPGSTSFTNVACATLPTAVPGMNAVVEIVMGNRTTCVLKRNGDVECWGANDCAQLGPEATGVTCTVDGLNLPCSATAVRAFSGASAIAAGEAHFCAIRASDHSVWCWGYAEQGQLGPTLPSGCMSSDAGAPTRCRSALSGGPSCAVPTQIPGVIADTVSCGGNTCCAISPTGQLRCWGSNAWLQLATCDQSPMGAVDVSW